MCGYQINTFFKLRKSSDTYSSCMGQKFSADNLPRIGFGKRQEVVNWESAVSSSGFSGLTVLYLWFVCQLGLLTWLLTRQQSRKEKLEVTMKRERKEWQDPWGSFNQLNFVHTNITYTFRSMSKFNNCWHVIGMRLGIAVPHSFSRGKLTRLLQPNLLHH